MAHSGSEKPRIQIEVLGHLLVHTLICLHHSHVCFAQSDACGTVNNLMAIFSVFFSILDHTVADGPTAISMRCGETNVRISQSVRKHV